jgi:hypothetical protein
MPLSLAMLAEGIDAHPDFLVGDIEVSA